MLRWCGSASYRAYGDAAGVEEEMTGWAKVYPPPGPIHDPQGPPDGGDSRVQRGGSFQAPCTLPPGDTLLLARHLKNPLEPAQNLYKVLTKHVQHGILRP